jgi:hypothetical protein
MKKCTLLTLILISSASIFGTNDAIEGQKELPTTRYDFGTDSYTGRGYWHFPLNARVEFTKLSGIQMDAIDEAMGECLKDNDRCVLKAIETVENKNRHERRRIKYDAIVQSIDSIPDSVMNRRGTYTGEFNINHTGGLRPLQERGVRKLALEQALDKCYRDGNDLCTLMKTQIDAVNTPLGNQRYRSNASAKVRGYQLIRFRKSAIDLGEKLKLYPEDVIIEEIVPDFVRESSVEI